MILSSDAYHDLVSAVWTPGLSPPDVIIFESFHP